MRAEEVARLEVRQLYIQRADVQTHSPTTGCGKCAAVAASRSATKRRSAACRERIVDNLKCTLGGTAQIAQARERLVEEKFRQSDESRKRARADSCVGVDATHKGQTFAEQMAERNIADASPARPTLFDDFKELV